MLSLDKHNSISNMSLNACLQGCFEYCFRDGVLVVLVIVVLEYTLCMCVNPAV